MSKHAHLQNLAEQISKKGHGSAPFHYEKEASKSMKAGDVQKNGAVDDGPIQLRAYQIYKEKGGSELDNWLEAERSFKTG